MVRWLYRSATTRRLLALFFMVLVFPMMLLPWVAERFAAYSSGRHPIDVNLGFSPAIAYDTLDALGPDGRMFYLLVLLTMDVAWPIVYALFLGTVLAWLFAHGIPSASPLSRLVILPFLALAADYAENIGIVAMILAYPQQLTGVAQVTSTLQLLKWGLVAISGLLVLVGAAAVARRRARA